MPDFSGKFQQRLPRRLSRWYHRSTGRGAIASPPCAPSSSLASRKRDTGSWSTVGVVQVVEVIVATTRLLAGEPDFFPAPASLSRSLNVVRRVGRHLGHRKIIVGGEKTLLDLPGSWTGEMERVHWASSESCILLTICACQSTRELCFDEASHPENPRGRLRRHRAPPGQALPRGCRLEHGGAVQSCANGLRRKNRTVSLTNCSLILLFAHHPTTSQNTCIQSNNAPSLRSRPLRTPRRP